MVRRLTENLGDLKESVPDPERDLSSQRKYEFAETGRGYGGWKELGTYQSNPQERPARITSFRQSA